MYINGHHLEELDVDRRGLLRTGDLDFDRDLVRLLGERCLNGDTGWRRLLSRSLSPLSRDLNPGERRQGGNGPLLGDILRGGGGLGFGSKTGATVIFCPSI